MMCGSIAAYTYGILIYGWASTESEDGGGKGVRQERGWRREVKKKGKGRYKRRGRRCI